MLRYEALCANFSFSFFFLLFIMIRSLFRFPLVFDDFSESGLYDSVLMFFFIPGTFGVITLIWGNVVIFEGYDFLFCFIFHFPCFFFFKDFISYYSYATW